LGFRVVLEDDEQLRVIDAKTGERYARPDEAQAALVRAQTLEKELARLRAVSSKGTKGKGKRRKP
jgi:hypothetical protein